MATTDKPLPHETEDSQPYWAKAKGGVLAIQRCADCGRLRHYPRLVCDNCHSLEADWIDASGRAVLHSWTVAHHAFHPGFAGDVPYVLATVELEEGPRALGILDCPADAGLKPGMAVTARFEQRADGASELHFAPA
ncbi:MAG: Zn-ribbon domain-containing OB-fold protein [Hyphomicrobiales bacterium]|nr:Zn-ribbon domain-containing OB-fold protein [Hyphomicrobiales bacterium]